MLISLFLNATGILENVDFKTAGGANRHMEREHKEEQLQPYARAKSASKSMPTCQSLKRKRAPDSPVVTTLSSSKGHSVCVCLSVCVSECLFLISLMCFDLVSHQMQCYM